MFMAVTVNLISLMLIKQSNSSMHSSSTRAIVGAWWGRSLRGLRLWQPKIDLTLSVTIEMCRIGEALV